MARRVHFSLLPKAVPSFAGLEIGAATRPASLVGGDFYDFIAYPDGPLTFVVGDISGNGIPAAMLMGVTRAIVRAEANIPQAPTPEGILNRSNAKLYEDFTQAGMFATLFVGRWVPSRAELLYANAGHSPVIYCLAGGRTGVIEADGPAIGVLPASLSKDQILPFGPGDVLVVGTDGLSEARDPRSKMFGFPRLIELVGRLSHQPAQEIAECLLASVKDYRRGEEQEDDQTLVVVKCTGG